MSRFRESDIEPGDFLRVVKNNHHWLEAKSDAGFIANGDIVEVLEIFAKKEIYSFKFAHVKVKRVDYAQMKSFEIIVILNTLTAESPSLTYNDSCRL